METFTQEERRVLAPYFTSQISMRTFGLCGATFELEHLEDVSEGRTSQISSLSMLRQPHSAHIAALGQDHRVTSEAKPLHALKARGLEISTC